MFENTSESHRHCGRDLADSHDCRPPRRFPRVLRRLRLASDSYMPSGERTTAMLVTQLISEAGRASGPDPQTHNIDKSQSIRTYPASFLVFLNTELAHCVATLLAGFQRALKEAPAETAIIARQHDRQRAPI
jgi:hypothetical protein